MICTAEDHPYNDYPDEEEDDEDANSDEFGSDNDESRSRMKRTHMDEEFGHGMFVANLIFFKKKKPIPVWWLVWEQMW